MSSEEESLIERAREIDCQLPKAPWNMGEISASQADIVDGAGNWVGCFRKDFDEDSEDKPLIVELRNMLPELLKAFAQTKPPSAAEIAEIEKWSRWSLQPGITTDDQTLKNAIGYVAALLKVVHRQGYQLQCADKAQENIKSIHDLAVVRKEEAEEREDKALAGLAAADEKIHQLRADLARSIAITDLHDLDAATCRDVTRCATKCADLRRQVEHLRGEIATAGAMIVRVREEANQQRARAEVVEEALAAKGRWQRDAPTPGRWRVSIRPELRRGFPAVVECQVWPSADGLTVNYREGGDILPLDQDWFTGALWQRIEETADPFAAVERPYS